jgi:hypothetical protein
MNYIVKQNKTKKKFLKNKNKLQKMKKHNLYFLNKIFPNFIYFIQYGKFIFIHNITS